MSTTHGTISNEYFSIFYHVDIILRSIADLCAMLPSLSRSFRKFCLILIALMNFTIDSVQLTTVDKNSADWVESECDMQSDESSVASTTNFGNQILNSTFSQLSLPKEAGVMSFAKKHLMFIKTC